MAKLDTLRVRLDGRIRSLDGRRLRDFLGRLFRAR